MVTRTPPKKPPSKPATQADTPAPVPPAVEAGAVTRPTKQATTRKRTAAAPKVATIEATKPRTAPLAATPAPAVKPVEPSAPEGKSAKAKKPRLVRDSFTMPETEYAAIAGLKKRCLNLGLAAKKSEVLRAAIALLTKQTDVDVAAAIQNLTAIKTGRPAKASK